MSDWMKKKVESDKGKFESPPPGSHPANLIGIIDLGTQEEEYQGVAKSVHQILLVWELCSEVVSGTNNRHVLGEVYNFSANPKAKLRIMLEAWRGRKYQEGEDLGLDKALGKPALVNITTKTSKTSGKEYSLLAGVMTLPKGMPIVPPQRAPVMRACDEATGLPEWVPHIYGEDPREVIDRAAENRPKEPHRSQGNGKHMTLDADATYPPAAAKQAVMVNTNENDTPF